MTIIESEDLKQRASCALPQPTGTGTMRRCWNKSPDICPGCAKIHRLHTKFIIWSGINENSEPQEEQVKVSANYLFYFVTLTAPSFGKVHVFDKHSTTYTFCDCGKQHKADDSEVSTPLELNAYRYSEQVRWNFYSNDLYRRTQENLRRRYPEIETCYVREPQKRGVVHYHVIVRVPSYFDQVEVMEELKQLRAQTLKIGSHVYKWGRQTDVQRVNTNGDDINKTVSYTSKLVGYTTKTIGLVENINSPERREFTRRLRRAAAKITCQKKNDCKGKDCESKTHTNIGFHGRQFGHTNGWSFTKITYKNLHEEMRTLAEIRALAEGRDPNEPNYHMENEANNHARRSALEMVEIIGKENLHKVDGEYLNYLGGILDNW